MLTTVFGGLLLGRLASFGLDGGTTDIRSMHSVAASLPRNFCSIAARRVASLTGGHLLRPAANLASPAPAVSRDPRRALKETTLYGSQTIDFILDNGRMIA